MLKLVQLDTCESTNDEAWKHLPETTLVVTRRQTRGRGRQGRSWLDDEKNIMASLALVPPPGLLSNFFWMPLAAGVAAAEAIELACKLSENARNGLRLKWPNDIMWEQAKLGGILCESRLSGDQLAGVVIGMGLNVTTTPDVKDMQVTSLGEHAPTAHEEQTRIRILSLWADRIQFWLEELAQGRTGQLRKAWLKHAKLEAFPEFTVHSEKGEVLKLKALDLDDSGRLKAANPDSSKIVYLDQPG